MLRCVVEEELLVGRVGLEVALALALALALTLTRGPFGGRITSTPRRPAHA